MTPNVGDLVVLNISACSWAEVSDEVYEFPTPPGSRSDKAHVLRHEHGIVLSLRDFVACVFFASGVKALVVRKELVVVSRPLPPAALTALFAGRTVVSASN